MQNLIDLVDSSILLQPLCITYGMPFLNPDKASVVETLVFILINMHLQIC